MSNHRSTMFCKHYRAMLEHKTCKAGVAYVSMSGMPFDERPCFAHEGDTIANPGCDLVQLPTLEEQKQERAEDEARFANLRKARQAIVEHLGGPWKRGMDGASGQIDCPVCDNPKGLRFTRSGYNGHIHAKCGTQDCVSWME